VSLIRCPAVVVSPGKASTETERHEDDSSDDSDDSDADDVATSGAGNGAAQAEQDQKVGGGLLPIRVCQ
jgi:hypothetical protein